MKRMKSSEVRTGWRDVLDYVRSGGTVVIEHYDRPIARITPIEEKTMDAEIITDQVTTTLGDHPEDFDVAAIVEEIGDTYGRDKIRTVDDVPSQARALIPGMTKRPASRRRRGVRAGSSGGPAYRPRT
jgi:antitoxin (DNA-binding transcriptional repressor) of toxin-antitoxin stability system